VSVADQENGDQDSLAAFYAKMAKQHGVMYDHEELKVYLKYIRQKTPQPKLTSQAAETIKYYYMSMRDKPPCEDMPVTARQLESLVRLCQARARIEGLTEVPP
jgi:DNA replicative helicase MCM subunit Mcm2 (Cdc46/Mcm family)